MNHARIALAGLAGFASLGACHKAPIPSRALGPVPIRHTLPKVTSATPPDGDVRDIVITPTTDLTALHGSGFSGGPDEAARVRPDCAGYINLARPDHRLVVQGSAQSLRVRAHPTQDRDITLVVRAPDGSFSCRDSFADDSTAVEELVLGGGVGVYDMWVGSYEGLDARSAYRFEVQRVQSSPQCNIVSIGSRVGPDVVSGSNATGFNALHGRCGGDSGIEHAFAWTAPRSGYYRCTTEGSTFDTVLYARRGSGCTGTELFCNDDHSDNDADGTWSEYGVTVLAGDTIVIVVDTYAGVGTFTLGIYME